VVHLKTLSYLSHCRIHSNVFVYILVTLNKSIVTSASIVTRRGNVLFSLLSANCRRVSEETPNMSQYVSAESLKWDLAFILIGRFLRLNASEQNLIRVFVRKRASNFP
jgi:hypothetical protein